MDLETGILTAIAPILAAFAEWKNPVSDEVIKRQANQAVDELGLAATPKQSTALVIAIAGVARGAGSVASLLPTIIAFATTSLVVANDASQRFWWAVGIIVFVGMGVILIIRAVSGKTYFSLATDPAGRPPPEPAGRAARARIQRLWLRAMGRSDTGAERVSRLIYALNFMLVAGIFLDVAITAHRQTTAPVGGDAAQAMQALGRQIEVLRVRVKDQAALIDAAGAQITDLARRIPVVEGPVQSRTVGDIDRSSAPHGPKPRVGR